MNSLKVQSKKYIILPILLGAMLLVVCIMLALAHIQMASAANGKDFNPARIIDDAVFYNSSAMNVSQIQTFLNAKVPNCDTNGTQPASDWGYPNITHAKLAEYKRNGTNGFSKDTGFHAPPYTCLKDFKQNTPQMEAASGLCGGLIARSNRTAAQIIKDVSDACSINPQVLIVLLQKEQSLVTDNWPLNRQYKNATGFACPDTAPCNPAYNGYFYQVYHAARQFKVYKAYPTSYNYIAGRTNRIYWHPDLSRCGSSNVYIENQATAALYIYTPYRPNQAALNNLYGTGDSCSSYGNRNFWRLFTDWFGSTKVHKFIALETPRWFNIRVDTYKKNPLLDQPVDTPLSSGTQLRFTTKVYVNNTWYLRTEYDSDRGYMKGVPMDAVEEISYEPFETPRWMVFNKNGYKLNPVSAQEQAELFDKGSSLFFSSKMVVNGTLYYRTKWSTDNNKPEAFPATSFDEVTASPLETPRWMTARNNAYQKDLSKNTIPNTSTYAPKESHLYFTKKILLNGTWFFLPRDTDSETLAYSWSDFKELPLTFTQLGTPQLMKLKVDTFKQNPTSEQSVEALLTKDSQLYFTSRINIDGKWYMRTQYDTQHGHMKVIPLDKLDAV